MAKKSPTLSKIPLAGHHLFIGVGHLFSRRQVNTSYKMNEVVNRFLLAGDTFMHEMHLRQPEFRYAACAPFTNNKEYPKLMK